MPDKPETEVVEQPKQPTPEEARAVLAVERQVRAQQCLEEINAVLRRYRCRMSVQITVTPDGRLVGRPTIAPEE